MGLDGAPPAFDVIFTLVPLLMVGIIAFAIYGAFRRYRAAKQQGLDPFAADVQLMGEARRSLRRGLPGPGPGSAPGPRSPGTAAPAAPVEARLRELDRLRQAGLVGADEYDEQRRRILDDL